MTKDVQTYLKAQIAQLKNEVESSKAALRIHESEIKNAQQRIDALKATITQNEAVISALEKLVQKKDNRPSGWQLNGMVYYVPSKSRLGKSHEIVAAYNDAARNQYPADKRYIWSCNCESAKFRPGEDCWALKQVKSYVSFYTPLPFGAKRMWRKGSNLAPDKASEYRDDFGLINWND